MYNGLQLRHPTLNISFLKTLDTVFQDTEAVWGEGKPEKGFCCEAFWTSIGMNPRRANRLACERLKNVDVFGINGEIWEGDIKR